ncbi:MAG: 4-hydroxythreonine-4-phosphate dehydrogenase PdxA [Prevotella sp.]|nr:4-hydroxythreonine-4-phosphate dehydrogenase PdxA [Prevotella sp.]
MIIDNRKVRVAITQGDANGTGFEMIFKTFAEPDMLELCTPVVYGSPKIASYHSKALAAHAGEGADSEQTHYQYSIITKAEDARDDRLNLLVCFDDELKVEFGKRTPTSALPAAKAVAAAIDDCKKGLVDVLVCGPVDRRTIDFGGEKTNLGDLPAFISDKDGLQPLLFQNANMRIAVAANANLTCIKQAVNEDNISAKLTAVHAALVRDFRIDNPRIALLGLDLNDESEENAMLAGVVNKLYSNDIQVFGPYRSDRFFADRNFEAFDAVLAMFPEQALLPMAILSDEPYVAINTGLPFVCTAPCCDAQMSIAGRGKADCAPLRAAIYAAMDILAARRDYDSARTNPLQKLYKERSDRGEKPFFVPPKKTDGDGQQ